MADRSVKWLGLALALPAWLAAQHYPFRTYGQDEGLTSPAIRSIYQDRAGYLWVGTSNGLFRYDGDRFQRFGKEEGLQDARIRAIHETPGRVLFVATAVGVARLEGERFLAVDLGGKVSLAIGSALASDRSGRLYVACDRGLSVGRRGPGGDWHF